MADSGRSCTTLRPLLNTVGLSRFSCMEFPYMRRVSDSGEPVSPRFAWRDLPCGLPSQVTRSALPTTG